MLNNSQEINYYVFSFWSLYSGEHIFISNDVRDTKTSEPELIVLSLQFKSVDPVGASIYLDIH